MRIVLSGATGFIGGTLSKALTREGHDVVSLSRSGKPGTVLWNPAERTTDVTGQVDAIVHLAGEPIAGRWTASKKRSLWSSRVDGTATMAQLAIDSQVSHFLSGSAIGIYGSRGDELLSENASAGDGFLADLTAVWEDAASPAVQAGIPTAFLRTSLVLDRSGGSFPRMALPFKVGIGGKVGSGDQWWSWITLRDEVRAIEHILTTQLTGPVNLAAPQPVRNGDFAEALGRAMHRPAVFPTPAFGLGLVLGSEFAEQVLLASQRVVPTVLEQSGFAFTDGSLPEALSAILA